MPTKKKTKMSRAGKRRQMGRSPEFKRKTLKEAGEDWMQPNYRDAEFEENMRRAA